MDAHHNNKKNTTKKKAEEQKAQTQSSIGLFLQQHREEQGHDLQAVSDVINVRTAQLKAIEDGDLSSLPGMAYAVGFVRSYADFLGLDSQAVVQSFKEEHTEMPEKPELHFPVPVSDTQLPDFRIMGSAVAGIVVILLLWGILSGDDQEETEKLTSIPHVPAELVVKTEDKPNDILLGTKDALPSTQGGTENMTTAATEMASNTAQSNVNENKNMKRIEEKKVITSSETKLTTKPKEKSVGKEATALKNRIIIRAKEASWVQIQDSKGRTVFKKVLRIGDEYRVPNKQTDLEMITANAGGLEITVDGKIVDPLGKSGDIIRGFALTVSELKQSRGQHRKY